MSRSLSERDKGCAGHDEVGSPDRPGGWMRPADSQFIIWESEDCDECVIGQSSSLPQANPTAMVRDWMIGLEKGAELTMFAEVQDTKPNWSFTNLGAIARHIKHATTHTHYPPTHMDRHCDHCDHCDTATLRQRNSSTQHHY